VKYRFVLLYLALALLAVTQTTASRAAAKKVLFVTIAGGYDNDGINMFNEVSTVAGPGQATHATLTGNGGQVVAALAADTYEQIWVYDLSTGTDNYPNDYDAIRDWYNGGNFPREIICDARWLSSFWSGRFSGEGRELTENYFTAFDDAVGGGLLLATDHNVFSARGVNDINTRIGLNAFTGNFAVQPFPLDTDHPLSNIPNELVSLANDSSTGQTPFGLQPGGRTLQTLGYHSGNTLSPGISTTISGGNLNFEVSLNGPSGALCASTNVYNATIVSPVDYGPYTYTWYLYPAGTAGPAPLDGVSGPTFTLDTSGYDPGAYVLRVIAVGDNGRADEATFSIEIGACECGGGAADLCLGEGTGAMFAIPVDGPTPGLYALCRLMPGPTGGNDTFDCVTDINGVIDLVDSSVLESYFGVGFCAAP
jgi:hypothetical protein